MNTKNGKLRENILRTPARSGFLKILVANEDEKIKSRVAVNILKPMDIKYADISVPLSRLMSFSPLYMAPKRTIPFCNPRLESLLRIVMNENPKA